MGTVSTRDPLTREPIWLIRTRSDVHTGDPVRIIPRSQRRDVPEGR